GRHRAYGRRAALKNRGSSSFVEWAWGDACLGLLLRFRLIDVNPLGLAADAHEEGLEVGIGARLLAVDRLSRNNEEVARARLDAFGSARAKFDRYRATDHVDVSLVGSMVVPAADVARFVPNP